MSCRPSATSYEKSLNFRQCVILGLADHLAKLGICTYEISVQRVVPWIDPEWVILMKGSTHTFIMGDLPSHSANSDATMVIVISAQRLNSAEPQSFPAMFRTIVMEYANPLGYDVVVDGLKTEGWI